MRVETGTGVRRRLSDARDALGETSEVISTGRDLEVGGMMRLVSLLFLALLTIPQAGLTAESDPPGLSGSRVRLLAAPLGPRKLTGTLVGMQGDSVLFAADHQSARTLIPTASLAGIEVSRGMHSHVWRGAGIGFLVGALAGGVVG